MSSRSPVVAEPAFLYRVGYLLAVTMIVLPLSDIALGLLPLQPESMRWRAGATGLIIGASLLPVSGLFLALVISHLRHQRALQYVLAILAGVGALALIGAAGLFLLDTLQVRNEVNPQQVKLYDRATVRSLLCQLLLVGVLLWMCVGSLRVSIAASRTERARKKDPRTAIVTAPNLTTPTSS